MKSTVSKTQDVEVFICDVCQLEIENPQVAIFLGHIGGSDYQYSFHEACLVTFLDENLPK